MAAVSPEAWSELPARSLTPAGAETLRTTLPSPLAVTLTRYTRDPTGVTELTAAVAVLPATEKRDVPTPVQGSLRDTLNVTGLALLSAGCVRERATRDTEGASASMCRVRDRAEAATLLPARSLHVPHDAASIDRICERECVQEQARDRT